YEANIAVPIGHVKVLPHFAEIYLLRSIAELEAGQTVAALQDLSAIDRIQSALQPEPRLLSHTVRLVMITCCMAQIVWQATVEHRWNGDQLASVQQMFERLNLLADCQQVMRGERAVFNGFFDAPTKKRVERSFF